MAEHHSPADAAPKPSSLPVIGSLLLVAMWGVLVIGFFGVLLPITPRL